MLVKFVHRPPPAVLALAAVQVGGQIGWDRTQRADNIATRV